MRVDSMDVSVIISTYNSDMNKLKRTLCSVACQKNVSYEVIITDDGSIIDCSETIEKFIKLFNISTFQIVRNQSNVGTVRNFYGAMVCAKGRYVYCTSPGDMLYDEDTLSDFYQYATNNKVNCVFGDAVYYSMSDNEIKLLKCVNCPEKPQIFDLKKGELLGKVAILLGHKICGASFFREKESAIKHMEEIIGTTKYVEDATTSMSYVLSGDRIIHYPRKIVWYECGTGISTSGESQWQKIIKSEILITKQTLFDMYSEDKVVRYIKGKSSYKNKLFGYIKMLLRYPIIGGSDIIVRLNKKVFTAIHKKEIDKIKKYFDV